MNSLFLAEWLYMITILCAAYGTYQENRRAKL